MEKKMTVPKKSEWRSAIARYQNPSLKRSWWEIANSVTPFLLLWYGMYRSLAVSYWLTLALSIPTAGFMVRTFIIFHDCGHGSFFKSQRLNDLVGTLTGILTLTPYYHWRHDHAIHHASAGNLDRRGVGDVKTLTVEEYRALPPLKRLGYRIFRNPLLMFTVGAWIVFIFVHRFYKPNSGKRERFSVYLTNLALLDITLLLSLLIGFKAFILVEFPVLAIATGVGVWLFYVQHNFDGTYWERQRQWDFVNAGLKGSSFYKLPGILQWFTGNIGFHHIHHLGPRIPNYLLPKCHRENPIFQKVKPLTILDSLKSLGYRLWDEQNRKLVGFKALKTRLI
jgi:omega-6 fatty acid desaturase (delta-12 desaturase)